MYQKSRGLACVVAKKCETNPASKPSARLTRRRRRTFIASAGSRVAGERRSNQARRRVRAKRATRVWPTSQRAELSAPTVQERRCRLFSTRDVDRGCPPPEMSPARLLDPMTPMDPSLARHSSKECREAQPDQERCHDCLSTRSALGVAT